VEGDAALKADAHAHLERACGRPRPMKLEGVVTVLRSLLVSWAVMAGAFAITAWLLNGMEVSGGFFAYLWIALLFGIVNAIIGTILRILTFPLTILTLGLSAVVVNAVLIDITDGITDHLSIDHFWWTAIWAAAILAFVSVCLHGLVLALLKTETKSGLP
jgi:putative membrane protein